MIRFNANNNGQVYKINIDTNNMELYFAVLAMIHEAKKREREEILNHAIREDK